MKVLLVGNYVPDGHTSMLAFSRVLERELPRLGCELRVVAPPKRVLRVPYGSRWWKWLGYIDKFILFIPSLVRHVRWADVVHICDHANAHVCAAGKGQPNVITCHDVIAMQAAKGMVEGWKVGWTGRLFQRLIVEGLAGADLVACDSDLTRSELLALGQRARSGKVTTVLNGLNDDFSPVAPDEAQRLIARFGLRCRTSTCCTSAGTWPQEPPRGARDLHRAAAARRRRAEPPRWCSSWSSWGLN